MQDKRKRLTGEERKKQILSHAFDLISQKGFKSISIRDIAKSAEINEALIYKHFPSKEALLTDVINEIIDKRPKCPEYIPETETEFIQVLSCFEEFFIDLNMKDPSSLKTILYAVMENYPMPSEFDITKEGTFLNWLDKCIDKGKKDWKFDKNNVNEVSISFFMGGLIYFILQTSVTESFKVDKETFEGSFSKLFIKTLKE